MKIVIIGNSGSGKTWLAEKLSSPTGTPVVHLDEIFWAPGGFDCRREDHEIVRLIRESAKRQSWIVEGVFGDLAQAYFDRADAAIWLDLEWEVCKSRLMARGCESTRHMGREQSEKGLADLMEWASHYYDRLGQCSRHGHAALIDGFTGRKLHLTSERQANRLALDGLGLP